MLTHFSRIVVPYDHSELSKKALKMAINFANQDETIELYVVLVIHSKIPFGNTYGLDLEAPYVSQHEVILPIRNEIMHELKRLSNKTRICVLEGNPAKVIIDFVKDNDADFIVMGSRGLSGLKVLFLGSVSHHVVQKATCPVLIVK